MKVMKAKNESKQSGSSGKSKTVLKEKGVIGKILYDFACGFLIFAKWIVLLLVDFTVVISIATLLVPGSVVVLSNMLGVGLESSLASIIFVFAFPCLFVTIMWCAFSVWFLKAINSKIRLLFDKIALIGSKKCGNSDGRSESTSAKSK